MIEVILGILLVFGIIFFVPFLIYGICSELKIINTPNPTNPKQFIYNLIITKLGTAVLFTWIFYYINLYRVDFWWIYGLIWVISSVIGEIGDTFKPEYTRKEALIGIISEMLYFPLSSFLLGYIL